MLNHGAENSTVEATVRTDRGSQNSTVVLSSEMEIQPHGDGGKFGYKVTKNMVERMRHFGEQASPSPETSWRCIPNPFGRLGVSVIRSSVRDLDLVENCPEFSDLCDDIFDERSRSKRSLVRTGEFKDHVLPFV